MKTALVTLCLILIGMLSVPVISLLYELGGGAACLRCHEMGRSYEQWLSSSHRAIPCTRCHGDALSGDLAFHLTNVLRVKEHFLGKIAERPQLSTADILSMPSRCAPCHRQEYAQWSTGPHSVCYNRLFLNVKHNQEQQLTDDCLRCHGMHFNGGIGDLVQPISTRGPWVLRRKDLADQPAIPCSACHAMHRPGRLLAKWSIEPRPTGPFQELVRPSVGFFDRRSQQSINLSLLPLPAMQEADRSVPISPDMRQAICYQCHAPLATLQVRSGDDRTPIGVHEGLGCFACHDQHRQTTRASCANCHPRLSNCGIPVEAMDTSFTNPDSAHNIHFVKCTDCHPKGVPPKKKVR